MTGGQGRTNQLAFQASQTIASFTFICSSVKFLLTHKVMHAPQEPSKRPPKPHSKTLSVGASLSCFLASAAIIVEI